MLAIHWGDTDPDYDTFRAHRTCFSTIVMRSPAGHMSYLLIFHSDQMIRCNHMHIAPCFGHHQYNGPYVLR